jgi:hypothetical protein
VIPPWVLYLIVAGVIVLSLTDGETGILSAFLATVQGRGSRVGTRTAVDDLGVVPDSPATLAASAALDIDTYALARMLSSENGNDPAIYKVAIGWAAVNRAGGRGIAEVLLSGHGDTYGHFARQNARYRTGALDADGEPATAHAGKYASTALDPREDDVAIGKAILAGEIPDPTGGATNFFSPRVQDAGYAAGKPGYTKDAQEVDAAWTAGGLVRVELDGIDARSLTFYKPSGVG